MTDTHEILAFGRALDTVQRLSDAPLAFGGPLEDGGLNVTRVVGGVTQSLCGLRVLPGRGLGGQAIQSRRLSAVPDYGAADTITHHYDRQVLTEGVRGLTAAPVVVHRKVRGMLYVGAKTTGYPGEVVTGPMLGVARSLSRELEFDEEVDKRVKQVLKEAETPASELMRGGAMNPMGSLSRLPHAKATDDIHELQEMHAELCGIAAALDDPTLRDRVQAAATTLAAWGNSAQDHGAGADFAAGRRGPGAHGVFGSALPEANSPTLSPRELDVLSQVELGRTNAQAAEHLDLMPETVKAYLRSASTKLQVHGRFQAVMEARRLGLLTVEAQEERSA